MLSLFTYFIYLIEDDRYNIYLSIYVNYFNIKLYFNLDVNWSGSQQNHRLVHIQPQQSYWQGFFLLCLSGQA